MSLEQSSLLRLLPLSLHIAAAMASTASAATTTNQSAECMPQFNVDDARELGSELNIVAMPTFKLYDGAGNELGAQRGWNEANLRKMIEQNGVQLAPEGSVTLLDDEQLNESHERSGLVSGNEQV